MSRRFNRDLYRDVGWLWSGYLGRSLAYLGLAVVLTRALGPSQFGELSLFLALTLGVSQVAGSWPFLAIPVLSGRERTIAAAFRPAARVAAMATAASLVVAIPVSIAIHSRAVVSVLALVVYSIALVALQGIYAVQQTEGRMSEIAAVQTGERVVGLLAVLAAVAVSSLSVLAAEAVLAGSAAVTVLAAFSLVGRRQGLLHHVPGDHPDHLVRTVMDAVGPMGIVSICSYGVAWADIFVLAAFRSNADVGVYSLAYQVFTFAVQLGSMWMVATLPRHARATAAGDEVHEQLPVGRIVSATSLWGAAVAVGAVAVGTLMPHIFGSGFKDAAAPLAVLLVGTIFLVGYFAVTPVLLAAGRTKLLARVALVSAAINIGLDLILIPPLGVVGPAVATTAQALFGLVALVLVAIDRRALERLLLAGGPCTVALVALAFDPTSPPLIALTLAAALLSAGIGLRSLRSAD